MKKILVLCAAAIVALGAFSCQKDDVAGIQTPEFNNEGLQKYTFTVSGVETKMAYDTDKTNHKLTPKWEVGDTIYVYDSEAYFIVTKVAESGAATVEGYAEPGSGQLTLIYYPPLKGKPGNFNLKAQEGHLDKNFPAIYYGYVDLGATKPSASFTLKSFILEISKVPGISSGSVIDSIIVEGDQIASGKFKETSLLPKTSLTPSGDKVKADLTSWTNSCNVVDTEGTLSENVFISLAPGSISKITVWTNDKSEYCWAPANAISLAVGAYRYVSAKTFSLVTPVTPDYPGTDKLPVKVGEIWWAPVNCGYSNSNQNGLLYQWGRKYGQNYDESRDDDSIAAGPVARSDDASNYNKFIKDKSDNKVCWYTGAATNDTWAGDYNPCPEGWRVPTQTELQQLGQGTWTGSARLFADGKLTFPAAGYTPNNGDSDDINEYGYYWSSNTSGSSYAIYMVFYSSDLHVYNNDNNGYRSRGMSVRCVKNAN